MRIILSLMLLMIATKSYANCSDQPNLCDHANLCRYATIQSGDSISWQSQYKYRDHVVEAKKRGLSCTHKIKNDDNEASKSLENLFVLRKKMNLNILSAEYAYLYKSADPKTKKNSNQFFARTIIKEIQKAVGTESDGIWGPGSRRKLLRWSVKNYENFGTKETRTDLIAEPKKSLISMDLLKQLSPTFREAFLNRESQGRPTGETLITPSNSDVAVNTILGEKTVNLTTGDDNLPGGLKNNSSISLNILHLESYEFDPYYCGFQGTLSSAELKNYREVVVFFYDPKINRYTAEISDKLSAEIRKNFTMNKLENITFEKLEGSVCRPASSVLDTSFTEFVENSLDLSNVSLVELDEGEPVSTDILEALGLENDDNESSKNTKLLETNNTLNFNIEKLSIEIDNLKNKIANYEVELEDAEKALTTALEDRDQEIERLKMQLADTAGELAQTERALAETLTRQRLLEDQITALHRLKTRSEVNERGLRAAQKTHLAEIDQLKTKLSASKKSLTEKQEDQTASLELLTAMQSRLKSALWDLAKLDRAHQEAEDASLLLQAKLNSKAKELRAVKAKAGEQARTQAAQIAQAELEKVNLEEQLGATLAEKTKLEESLTVLLAEKASISQNQKSDPQDRTRDEEIEITRLKSMIANMTERFNESQKIQADTLQLATTLQAYLSETITAAAEAEEKILSLETAIEEKNDDREPYAGQELDAGRLQDSVLALNAAQLQLADRDQDIERLQAQVADSTAELDQTEVALAAALARQLLLEDQITALQRQRAQLEEQERTLSQTQAQQADAIKRLQTALTNSEKSRTESQDNQSSALELAKALQAQLSAALAAVAQAEDARALLQAKVDATTKELEAATNQAANQAAAQIAQAAEIAQAETAKASLEENLVAALAAKLAAEADMNKVAAQLKAALAAKLAADQDLAAQLDERKQQQSLVDKSQELQKSDAQLLKAERQAAALNQQVTALRQQLAKVSDLLEISEEKDVESQAQLQNLGNRLNAALARAASEQRRRLKLEEAESQRLEAEKLKLEAERDLLASQAEDLAKYKSEFFGSLRILLADQVGVRIVGDRFVFSSEVLFAPGAAELSRLGQSEIVKVGSILNKIMSEIPQNIDWIIRVDGHTDDQPLSGTGEFKDNWELSQARALSVVKFMISQLNIPADRLAANGFAEFQPVNTANTVQARSQNRRIELKLSER